jgi:antitoxin CptB
VLSSIKCTFGALIAECYMSKSVNVQPSKMIKQLLYRCWHRGMKEVDIILGSFLKACYNQLSAKDCEDLHHLLDCNDQDLLAWILNGKPIPEFYATEVIFKIQHFTATLSNHIDPLSVPKEI